MSDFEKPLVVIGEAIPRTRSGSQVHAQHLLHRAVHILIFDQAGRVFLRQRAGDKELSPGRWSSSVGQHVFAGQSPEPAATEALKDFLGLDVKLEFLGEEHIEDETENELVTFYVGQGDTIPRINTVHSAGGSWLSVDDIQRMPDAKTTPHGRAAIRLFVHHART
ncbi:MAG: NUDIX domain-containing protein [Candidatus Kerfeldbacteria bacterium]|nr:NUDIX domain-containing protein [Candidatus Kerfeldbacteria bacterium]